MAGELSNYQTSSQVSSAISSALSSYDNSRQVDSKIITALLDFYTQVETDQAIADAVTGGVDLLPSPLLLPARGAALPAHGDVLDVRAHPNRDRRRRRQGRLPGPNGRGRPLPRARFSRGSQGNSSTWSRSSSRPAS